MSSEVTVRIRRRVDDVWLDYVRACVEEDLDWIIAEEQNKPGRIAEMDVSPAE